MLVALTNSHERFVIDSSIPLSTLRQLRTSTKFYCPQCKQQLQLKVGSIKIPHFAHEKNSSCDNSFSDGESVQHLTGKIHLYELFLSLGLNVQLEPYLSHLQQRPDLLVDKKFAIEFQCSPIASRFAERNAGYKKASITPIWIPLTPAKLKETGILKLSLNKQHQQFIVFANHQRYIMFYNPTLRQFFYVTNILYIQGNTFIAKVQAIPLMKQQFPFYLPKTLSKNEFRQYLSLYNQFKHNYLKSRVLISRKGVNDLFLRSVYELRLTIQSLPPFLGIPLKGNKSISTFSVEWQTALFYFLKKNSIHLSTVNSTTIQDFMRWFKIEDSQETIDVVRQYCKFLKTHFIEHSHQEIEQRKLEDYLYSHFLANE